MRNSGKILCAAIAFTSMIVSAQSQTKTSAPTRDANSLQMFGVVDMFAYHKQLSGTSSSNIMSAGGMSTSFWGLKGNEYLGGALNLEFEMTSFFRPSTGAMGRSDSDPFLSRSAWVGFRDSWGSLHFGRQTTLAFLNMVRFNSYGGAANFNPSFLHNYLATVTQPMLTASGAADSAWNGMVNYRTPVWNGFSGNIAYARPSEGVNSGTRKGLGVSFTKSKFAAGLVLEKIDGMNLNYGRPMPPPSQVFIEKSKLVSFGISYDFDLFKLYGQAISTKLEKGLTNIKLDTLSTGVSVPVGSGKILASYAQTRKKYTGLQDTTRRTLTIGYDYVLSKRTDLYANIMYDKLTNENAGTGIGFGIRHRF